MPAHFFTLLILFHITDNTVGINDVDVVFLRTVSRPNSSSLTDHYFSCNVHGKTLQWQVNNAPLGGFEVGDLAHSIVDKRTNFDYTSTLLSVKRQSHLATFDSDLIVSVEGQYQHIEVMCSSDLNYNITNNEMSMENVTRQNHTVKGIYFDYVLVENILKNVTKNKTHIFVCTTDTKSQFLEVNRSQIGFGSRDPIGQNISVLSPNGIYVNQQAVLVARILSTTTTVFFVTYNYSFVVSCSSGQYQAQFLVDDSNAVEPTTVATSSGTPSVISTKVQSKSTGKLKSITEVNVMLDIPTTYIGVTDSGNVLKSSPTKCIIIFVLGALVILSMLNEEIIQYVIIKINIMHLVEKKGEDSKQTFFQTFVA